MGKTITVSVRQIVIFLFLCLLSVTSGSASAYYMSHDSNEVKTFPNNFKKINSPTQANYENAKLNGPKLKAQYFNLREIKGMNDVVTVFKGACYNYLINKSYCDYMKFNPKIFGTNDTLAVTNFNFSNKNNIYADSIDINPILSTFTTTDVQWIAYHELSHVQTALIAKTYDKMLAIDSRANAAYPTKGNVGGGEVLTDCMTANMAGAYYTSTPGYIQSVKSYNPYDPFSFMRICKNWSKILYGDDKQHKFTPPHMPGEASRPYNEILDEVGNF